MTDAWRHLAVTPPGSMPSAEYAAEAKTDDLRAHIWIMYECLAAPSAPWRQPDGRRKMKRRLTRNSPNSSRDLHSAFSASAYVQQES